MAVGDCGTVHRETGGREGGWPIRPSSCQNRDPEMLSTSNFYDGNVIYVVWKDKLA